MVSPCTQAKCEIIVKVTETIEFEPTIPVINLAKLDSCNSATRQEEMNKLENALKIGFFAVEDANVKSNILETAYTAIRQFFDLPEEKRIKIDGKSTGYQRGYVPGETGLNQIQADKKVFLHVGPQNNLWPADMDLETPVMALQEELMHSSSPLLRAISMHLGQSDDFLPSLVQNGDSLLRCIRYMPNPENGQWAAEHTDLNLITILPYASAKGLQVKLNGEWVPVIVPKNAFVVNVGDLLETYSNGLFKSCEHRVIAHEPNTIRESIVFFLTIQNEATVKPLINGAPAYPETNAIESRKLRQLTLGYFNGLKEEINAIANSRLVNRMREMIEQNSASDTVKSWYTGFQKTICMMTQEGAELQHVASQASAAYENAVKVMANDEAAFAKKVLKAGEQVKTAFKDAILDAEEDVELAAELAEDAVEIAAKRTEKAAIATADMIRNAAVSTAERIKNAAVSTAESIKNTVSSTAEKTKEAAKAAVSEVEAAAVKVEEGAKAAYNRVVKAEKEVEAEVEAAAVKVEDGAKAAFNRAVEAEKDIEAAVEADVADAIAKAKSAIKTVYDEGAAIKEEIANEIDDFFSDEEEDIEVDVTVKEVTTKAPQTKRHHEVIKIHEEIDIEDVVDGSDEEIFFEAEETISG